MARAEFTEKKIGAIEGFAVRLLHGAPGNGKGRDVRGDKQNLPTYTYRRKAAGDQTVAAWVEGRFKKIYPGFGVEVLDGNGKKVHGKTKLSNLRETYTKPE